MPGSVVSAVQELADAVSDSGGKLEDIRLDDRAYSALERELSGRLPLDIHEVCGDYDRPGSPWFGSRPSDTGFKSIKIYTNAGYVNVLRT